MFSSLLLMISLLLVVLLLSSVTYPVHSSPPPYVDKLLASELRSTHADYGGSHPFETNTRKQRRKLDEEPIDPDQTTLEYNYFDRSYEPLRIKYITDPIESQSAYYDTGFDQVLPDILDVVSQTWSSHLSVFPVNGVIPIDQSDCFGFFQQHVPQDLQAFGVADADMAVYVGAESTIVDGGQQIDLCEAGTLAFAFTCSIDQFDRPIIGAINYCIDNIRRRLEEVDGNVRKLGLPFLKERARPAAATATLEGNDPTADLALLSIHEVAHALGFTINLMKYFRDSETGDPLTPRPFERKNVMCVDGSTQNLEWPETNTIQTTQNSDGRTVHEVVTPRVAQVVRNHFDCQIMTGARLENQPTSGGFFCTGTHWDERLFLSELMGAIFSGYTDTLSPLTLALFEDSGWYKVSYEHAMLSPYGKGRGCDFVNEPCIVNDQVPDHGRDVFCTAQSAITDEGVSAAEVVCDPTHKSFAACDLFDITTMPADVVAILPNDRIPRFSNPDLVSIFNRADYCPLPVIDARLDCTNNLENTDLQTYRGESRGLNSRCVNGQLGSVAAPGCFEVECSASLHKVIINGQVCDFDGQQLPVQALDFQSATLECPVLATVCPNLFCPGECSGRGVCNYDVVPPRCECFDANDVSAACNNGPASPAPQPTSAPPPTWSASEPTSGAPAQAMTAILGSVIMSVLVLVSTMQTVL